MSEKIFSPIPTRLKNVSSEDPYVATAEDIIDETQNKKQSEINAIGKTFRESKGVAGGIASLDGAGKVPPSQLPSYVDDVLEGYYYGTEDPDTHEVTYDFYSDAEHTDKFTPESGKIYIDIPSELNYRWTGSVYRVMPSAYVLPKASPQTLGGVKVGRGLSIEEDGTLSAQASSKTNAENGNGIGTCTTPSGTALEVALFNYELVVNGFVAVTFEHDVPAGATLNVNDKGAKPIYYKGSAVEAAAIKANDTVILCYDGTNYVVAIILGKEISPFTGATSSTNGSKGLVPAPLIADKDKFLKGDGTWGNVSGEDSRFVVQTGTMSYKNAVNGYNPTYYDTILYYFSMSKAEAAKVYAIQFFYENNWDGFLYTIHNYFAYNTAYENMPIGYVEDNTISGARLNSASWGTIKNCWVVTCIVNKSLSHPGNIYYRIIKAK